MKTITPQSDDFFVYSCTSEEQWGYEQFIPEHILAYQMAGETHIFHQGGTIILKKNQILLAHRNQFAKSLKIPATDKEYKAVSIILKSEDLKKYAIINGLNSNKCYTGKWNIILQPDSFLKGYFQSLIPYLEQPHRSSKKMVSSKIVEAIELLRNAGEEYQDFLFDFSEPHKIDIEVFMLKNFRYKAPIENFTRLTGRSLAGFKRDFINIFSLPPAKWLKEKRLEEAHYLMHKKNKKPSDIYLDLGFENLSHFYTSFKNKYGVTPTESLIAKK